LLLAGVSVEAAYVELNNRRKIQGVEISADAKGTVTLITATGQKMQFKKGQYRAAVADRPQEMEQISELLKKKKYAEAVALLKQVKTKYRNLGWDRKASYVLVSVLFTSGKYAEAAAEAAEYLAQSKDEKIAALRVQALEKTGDIEKLMPALEKDIAEGSRDAAARAYLLRGDLKAKAGDFEGARLDWLKVATLFRAQKEAARQALEKLEKGIAD